MNNPLPSSLLAIPSPPPLQRISSSAPSPLHTSAKRGLRVRDRQFVSRRGRFGGPWISVLGSGACLGANGVVGCGGRECVMARKMGRGMMVVRVVDEKGEGVDFVAGRGLCLVGGKAGDPRFYIR